MDPADMKQRGIDPSKLDLIKKIIRKPHVNAECIGCSVCTSISPQVFELDDETGLSCVKPLEHYDGHDVDDAIAACPVSAISWQDADEAGTYFDGIEEHGNIPQK